MPLLILLPELCRGLTFKEIQIKLLKSPDKILGSAKPKKQLERKVKIEENQARLEIH